MPLRNRKHSPRLHKSAGFISSSHWWNKYSSLASVESRGRRQHACCPPLVCSGHQTGSHRGPQLLLPPLPARILAAAAAAGTATWPPSGSCSFSGMPLLSLTGLLSLGARGRWTGAAATRAAARPLPRLPATPAGMPRLPGPVRCRLLLPAAPPHPHRGPSTQKGCQVAQAHQWLGCLVGACCRAASQMGCWFGQAGCLESPRESQTGEGSHPPPHHQSSAASIPAWTLPAGRGGACKRLKCVPTRTLRARAQSTGSRPLRLLLHCSAFAIDPVSQHSSAAHSSPSPRLPPTFSASACTSHSMRCTRLGTGCPSSWMRRRRPARYCGTAGGQPRS